MDTRDGIHENYLPLIVTAGHMHREKLKTLAYLAKADGEGVLIRSFMENDPDEIDLLHKRRLKQAHLHFSGHRLIRLRERVVSCRRYGCRRVGWCRTRPWCSRWWGTPGRSGRRWSGVFDHVRKKLIALYTGDKDRLSGNIFRAVHGHALLARAGVGFCTWERRAALLPAPC